jgi:lysophospholipase L1-like esterase
MAAVAREEGVPVVPLAEKAGAYFAAHPDTVYASDDFHPGTVGYRAWADAIFPVISKALAADGR